jgi:RHS repeat-associated protein
LQDLKYTYDPVGNITSIRDDAQQTIFFRNKKVEPSAEYTYDAVYRLIEATGREHLGQAGQPVVPDSYSFGHSQIQHPSDGNAMGTYSQKYVYDAVGNILKMQHRGTSPANPGWTLNYKYEEDSQIEKPPEVTPAKKSNRLSKTNTGSGDGDYDYDLHGNMTKMPHLPILQWDNHDQLVMTCREVGNPASAEKTYYVYDSQGQRVRKVTENSVGAKKHERVYLGGFEVYRKYDASGTAVTLERETLHVMDDKQRIAMVERRTKGTEGEARLIRYQLNNHLGTACIELDHDSKVISYEEYFPYGATSYQAVRAGLDTNPKRYRYTGKERDEENGLYYHGARYYASWLGRWTSCDPAIWSKPSITQRYDQSYVYVEDRPIVASDPDGRAINLIAAAAGAAAGAIIGFGIEAGRQLITDGNVTNWNRVGAASAGGAVSGGLAGLTMGASLAVQATAATAGAVAGGAVSRAVAGEPQTAGAVAVDAAVGIATFGIVRGGSALVQSARNTAQRQAAQQLERSTATNAIQQGEQAAIRQEGVRQAETQAGRQISQESERKVGSELGRKAASGGTPSKATQARAIPLSTGDSVREKLWNYLLNPDHKLGSAKAKWFKEALGFSRENFQDLANQIKFDPSKAIQTEVTQFGAKFNQVISIQGANGKVIDVTFAWIKNTDGVVRLITGIPTKR